jgi:hypothetical protein
MRNDIYEKRVGLRRLMLSLMRRELLNLYQSAQVGAKTYFVCKLLTLLLESAVDLACYGVGFEMACTYSTIEIQRTPAFRVYKKCLFHNISCAEVRGSGKCPLLKRTSAEEGAKVAPAPKNDRDVLNEELQRFDGIPSFGGEFKTRVREKAAEVERIERSKPKATTNDADLLEAELSDFMEKIETKKEKPTLQEEGGVSKKVQGELRRARTRKTAEK